MRLDNWYLLVFVVGLLLVLNPLLIGTGNGGDLRGHAVYGATPTDSGNMSFPSVRDLDDPPVVLGCFGTVTRRQCAHARHVGYNGSLRLPDVPVELDSNESELNTDIDYVKFEEGWAEPNATRHNGALVLRYDPVSRSEVLDAYSVEFATLPDYGKQAIRTGRGSVTRRSDDFDGGFFTPLGERRLVEWNGSLYLLEFREGSVELYRFSQLVRVLRLGGVAVGLVLLGYGKLGLALLRV